MSARRKLAHFYIRKMCPWAQERDVTEEFAKIIIRNEKLLKKLNTRIEHPLELNQ